MNRLLKTTLLLAAGGAAIVILIWIGAFLYWHVRITQAIRIWEKESSAPRGFNLYWRESGAPPEANRILEQAGCRALPYFVHGLGGSGTPYFKGCLVSRTIQVLAGPVPRRNPEVLRALTERYEAWDPNPGDSPARVAERFAALRRWWQENGDRHHQWWSVWSSSCPPDSRRLFSE
jgi:hypothetical protein